MAARPATGMGACRVTPEDRRPAPPSITGSTVTSIGPPATAIAAMADASMTRRMWLGLSAYRQTVGHG